MYSLPSFSQREAVTEAGIWDAREPGRLEALLPPPVHRHSVVLLRRDCASRNNGNVSAWTETAQQQRRGQSDTTNSWALGWQDLDL